MASCVRNIHTKNYQNLIIFFKVTVKNGGDFLRHSVEFSYRHYVVIVRCSKLKVFMTNTRFSFFPARWTIFCHLIQVR